MNAEHGETEGDESPEAEENVSPKQVFNRSDIWELNSYIAVCFVQHRNMFYEICVYLSLVTTREQSTMHDTMGKDWHNNKSLNF